MTDLDDVTPVRYSNVMTGFTKLFQGIVHSTIWREPMHVKIVWVTMLAMADRDGGVSLSIPGLADLSKVSLSECVDALARLKAPDEWSRTKEHEGRRIEDVDDGWVILNYLKYRNLMNRDDQRIKTRDRVQRHRSLKRVKRNVTLGNDIAEAEAEAEAEATTPKKKRIKETVGYTSEFEEFWVAYPSRAPGSNPKRLAADRFATLVSSGEATPETLIAQAKAYALFCDTTMRTKKWIMQASSFLGEKEGWRTPYVPTWKWLEEVDDEVKRDLVGENLGRILNV